MSRGPGKPSPKRTGANRGPKSETSERHGKPARTLSRIKSDRDDRPERPERPARPERGYSERPERDARPERRSPAERGDRPPRPGRGDGDGHGHERPSFEQRERPERDEVAESRPQDGPSRPGRAGRESRWSQERRMPREGEWYISGLNGVREALRSPHVKVRRVYAGSPAALAQLELGHDHGLQIEKVTDKDTIYGPLTQGVAVLVSEPNWPDPETLLDQLETAGRRPLLVALDQVEDPMNLGQILRTCEGSGVDGVIVLKHRSTHLNQTVAQVSQGAFAWMPVIEVVNLRQTLDLLKHRGLWVIGCEGSEGAQPWHRCRMTDPLVLVFGAEGSGLRTLTRKTCDVLACLPMQGHMESLNVGAAVSAFVYETARQRLLPPQ